MLEHASADVTVTELMERHGVSTTIPGGIALSFPVPTGATVERIRLLSMNRTEQDLDAHTWAR